MERAILNKLIEEKKTQRQIAEALSCSQGNIRYWLKVYNLKTDSGSNQGKGQLYTKEQLKSRRNKCGIENQRRRAIRRKLEYIQKLGGQCKYCGYSRNWAGLDFHHRDEKTKSFKMDLTNLGHKNELVLLVELAKCELLCAVCHREHHHPDKFIVKER